MDQNPTKPTITDQADHKPSGSGAIYSELHRKPSPAPQTITVDDENLNSSPEADNCDLLTSAFAITKTPNVAGMVLVMMMIYY